MDQLHTRPLVICHTHVFDFEPQCFDINASSRCMMCLHYELQMKSFDRLMYLSASLNTAIMIVYIHANMVFYSVICQQKHIIPNKQRLKAACRQNICLNNGPFRTFRRDSIVNSNNSHQIVKKTRNTKLQIRFNCIHSFTRLITLCLLVCNDTTQHNAGQLPLQHASNRQSTFSEPQHSLLVSFT